MNSNNTYKSNLIINDFSETFFQFSSEFHHQFKDFLMSNYTKKNLPFNQFIDYYLFFYHLKIMIFPLSHFRQ